MDKDQEILHLLGLKEKFYHKLMENLELQGLEIEKYHVSNGESNNLLNLQAEWLTLTSKVDEIDAKLNRLGKISKASDMASSNLILNLKQIAAKLYYKNSELQKFLQEKMIKTRSEIDSLKLGKKTAAVYRKSTEEISIYVDKKF